MRVKVSGIKCGLLLCLICLFFLSGPAHSDTINYVYDNLGRLVMTVTSNGLKIIYGYDQAGHVVSVTRMSENQQPPLLTGITPDSAFIGTEVSVAISGNNLLTTESVTTDNPEIKIINFSASNTLVTVDAEIQNTATIGSAKFTVKTLTGSASISLKLLSLTLTPARIVLAPGTSGIVTATIAGLESDYNLVLANQCPDLISIPQSITVPAAGTTTFAINALSPGNCVISAGNAAMSVFVSDLFTGTGTAGGGPVSVMIGSYSKDGIFVSPQVSVQLGGYLNSGVFVSSPVSVQPGFVWGSVISSPLVSVKISQ